METNNKGMCEDLFHPTLICIVMAIRSCDVTLSDRNYFPYIYAYPVLCVVEGGMFSCQGKKRNSLLGFPLRSVWAQQLDLE